MRKVLIQLIGQQTLPNIFPILAIQPDRVVNIYTEKTKPRHQKIVEWCSKYSKRFSVTPEFVECFPIRESVKEVDADIARIIKVEKELALADKDTMITLNITGGTKAMSSCALLRSMRLARDMKDGGCPGVNVVYLNERTRDIEFVYGEENREQLIVAPIKDIKLKVKELVDATGDAEVLGGINQWNDAYTAAEELRNLADNRILFKMAQFNRENFFNVVQQPLSSLLEYQQDSDFTAFKELAARAMADEKLKKSFAARCIVARDGDFYFSNRLQKDVKQLMQYTLKDQTISQREKNLKFNAIISEMQDATNFFVGGWWEIIVAHAYKKLKPEDEVLWSVRTAPKGDYEHAVETDIVATDGYSLCCISCKRGRKHDKVIQQLEQHCTRTNMLGGNIHECIIAFYRGDENISKLLASLKLKMWDHTTVRSIEANRYVDEKKTASVTPAIIISKPKPAAPATPAQQQPAAPASTETKLPLPKRIWAAVRLLFTGKI